MKERSLVERFVAILGVLVGTVAWVVRLLLSLLKGLLSGGGKPDSAEAGDGRAPVADTAKTYATEIKQKSESLLDDVKEKGESLIGDVKAKSETLVEKGQGLAEEARHKVDDVMHRGGDAAEGEGEAATFSAEGSTAADRSDVSATQHEGIGGVPAEPESGAVAAASLSAMDSVYDEQSAGSIGEEDSGSIGTHMTEGIPNLLEPGEADETDMYGSESGELLGRETGTDYAGQAVSQSDIGVDRGDSVSGLADSGEDQFRGWISDVVQTDHDETTGEDDDEEWVADQETDLDSGQPVEYDTAWVTDQINADDEEEDEDDDEDVPVASRGWHEPEDDVLKGDPLYGDVESPGTGGEVDLQNDEADEGGAGMHIVDSPDEPFIEDEDASQAMGFGTTGTGMAFDTTTGEGVDVDEIGDELVSIDEDQLAADAFGRPAGGDAASGDLGPDESPDDATWEPGASRSDYDVLGARDGSGVDEFADDSVAESMLADVTIGDEDDSGLAGESGEDSGGSQADTGSIAWATSAGVVDRDLAQPLSADELQSGSDVSSDADASDDTGATEADADLKDVAADVAQDLDREMGEDVTATGTTMSGAGQSAGAMTSDDAAGGEEGDGTTSDSGAVETGGIPATDAQDDEDAASGAASAGVTGSSGFQDVLPESEYASNVGYETLQADDSTRGGRDDFSESSFLTQTSTSGVTPATAGTPSGSTADKRRPAPSGSVRGDGSGTCPAGFPIKGNASSKIYHRPTDSSYESTIPEFCFATEEDAKAAGFRARKN